MSSEGISMDVVLTALTCQRPSQAFWSTRQQCQAAVIAPFSDEEAEIPYMEELSPARMVIPCSLRADDYSNYCPGPTAP